MSTERTEERVDTKREAQTKALGLKHTANAGRDHSRPPLQWTVHRCGEDNRNNNIYVDPNVQKLNRFPRVESIRPNSSREGRVYGNTHLKVYHDFESREGVLGINGNIDQDLLSLILIFNFSGLGEELQVFPQNGSS